MKQYTQTELTEAVNTIFGGDKKYSWETFDVKITKQTDKELLFEATHMYDWSEDKITPSFHQLKLFSEFFGTDNIDKYDDISQHGCETCDHGSKYGFAMRVWE